MAMQCIFQMNYIDRATLPSVSRNAINFISSNSFVVIVLVLLVLASQYHAVRLHKWYIILEKCVANEVGTIYMDSTTIIV